MIVVDANIFTAFLMESRQSQFVEAIFHVDSDWYAPPLLVSELLSVLSKNMRFASMTGERALELMSDAQKSMEGRMWSPRASTVIKLIRDSSLTSYDCEYVALAQELGAPLITLDKQILKEFPQIAFTPEAYLKR